MKSFTYKSYNFVDKDPIIDEVRTVFQESGVNYAWLQEQSGVTIATLHNWFDGETKRPQAATINAVLRALGYKLGVVPHSVPVQFRPAMEQARTHEDTSMRHVVAMNKYRRK
jgi:hypothetical protein